jgi:hypothetical protein
MLISDFGFKFNWRRYIEESLSSGNCFIGEGVGDYRIKSMWRNGTAESYKVGRCRLTVSKPVLKTPRVSELEAII